MLVAFDSGGGYTGGMINGKKLLLGIFLSIWFACTGLGGTIARYEARWWDGTDAVGDDLSGWNRADAQPRLGDRALFDPEKPMMWLVNHRVGPVQTPEAFVEMFSGDRLPGVVTGFRAAGVYQRRARPAHFIVQPAENVCHPEDRTDGEIGVDERFVRRIVWKREGGPLERYEPGTLYFRDGRMLRYRAVRFEVNGVRLLTEDGSRRAAFGEIAELHLPRREFRDYYFEELAILAPGLNTRLLQIETVGGLRITGSLIRFDAREASSGDDGPRWYHALQPAWSLQLLWVPHRAIVCYRSFGPHQVPLPRIVPSKVVLSEGLGGTSRWLVNRNAAGDKLSCAGRTGGWGFGCHASARWEFSLPQGARLFRTRFGLDDSVGGGGCIRFRVLVGGASKPIYESPIIIGSRELNDTGELQLPSSGGSTLLIIEFDAVFQGAPDAADPWNIRDICNLIDPVVELDPQVVQRETALRETMGIAAWHQWQVRPRENARIRTIVAREETNEGQCFVLEAAAEGGSFVLTRTMSVPADHQWLVLGCSVRSDYSDKVRLSLRAAGELMAEFETPVGNGRDERLLAFPIGRFAGKRVSFEVEQSPGDPRLSVAWRRLDTAAQLPVLRRLFDENEAASFAVVAGEKQPELIEADHYTGKRCIRLPAPGRYVLRLDEAIRVRHDPAIEEFRVIRWAARKRGGGRFAVAYQPQRGDRPTRYQWGAGPAIAERSQSVSSEPLHDLWRLYTRDLINDFDQGDLEAIIFDVPDGDDLLVDHIYVARRHDDLRWLPPELGWLADNAEARRNALDQLEKHTRESFVEVMIEGRRGDGVLVGEGRWVLTAGHLLGRPDVDAKVILADGREVSARTAGIDRGNNLGLIKLNEQVPLRSLGPSGWQSGQERHLFAAWWRPIEGDERAARLTPLWIEHVLPQTLWAEDLPEAPRSGAVLLNADGAHIVGILTRRSRFGGTLFSKAEPVGAAWDRFCRSEVWGAWLRGAGPSLGVQWSAASEGCLVETISGGPTVKLIAGDQVLSIDGRGVERPADIDVLLAERLPGDALTVEVRRNGKTIRISTPVIARAQ